MWSFGNGGAAAAAQASPSITLSDVASALHPHSQRPLSEALLQLPTAIDFYGSSGLSGSSGTPCPSSTAAEGGGGGGAAATVGEYGEEHCAARELLLHILQREYGDEMSDGEEHGHAVVTREEEEEVVALPPPTGSSSHCGSKMMMSTATATVFPRAMRDGADVDDDEQEEEPSTPLGFNSHTDQQQSHCCRDETTTSTTPGSAVTAGGAAVFGKDTTPLSHYHDPTSETVLTMTALASTSSTTSSTPYVVAFPHSSCPTIESAHDELGDADGDDDHDITIVEMCESSDEQDDAYDEHRDGEESGTWVEPAVRRASAAAWWIGGESDGEHGGRQPLASVSSDDAQEAEDEENGDIPLFTRDVRCHFSAGLHPHTTTKPASTSTRDRPREGSHHIATPAPAAHATRRMEERAAARAYARQQLLVRQTLRSEQEAARRAERAAEAARHLVPFSPYQRSQPTASAVHRGKVEPSSYVTKNNSHNKVPRAQSPTFSSRARSLNAAPPALTSTTRCSQRQAQDWRQVQNVVVVVQPAGSSAPVPAPCSPPPRHPPPSSSPSARRGCDESEGTGDHRPPHHQPCRSLAAGPAAAANRMPHWKLSVLELVWSVQKTLKNACHQEQLSRQQELQQQQQQQHALRSLNHRGRAVAAQCCQHLEDAADYYYSMLNTQHALRRWHYVCRWRRWGGASCPSPSIRPPHISVPQLMKLIEEEALARHAIMVRAQKAIAQRWAVARMFDAKVKVLTRVYFTRWMRLGWERRTRGESTAYRQTLEQQVKAALLLARGTPRDEYSSIAYHACFGASGGLMASSSLAAAPTAAATSTIGIAR